MGKGKGRDAWLAEVREKRRRGKGRGLERGRDNYLWGKGKEG